MGTFEQLAFTDTLSNKELKALLDKTLTAFATSPFPYPPIRTQYDYMYRQMSWEYQYQWGSGATSDRTIE